MKKIYFIIAVSLIVAGAVLFCLPFFTSGSFDFLKSLGTSEVKTYVCSEDSKALRVISCDRGVRIIGKATESGKIEITYSETEKDQCTISEKDGVLTVSQGDKLKWYDRMIFTFPDSNRITVALPYGIGKIEVKNKNGSVKLENVTATEADVVTSNGAIETEGTNIDGMLKCDTSNGHIYLSDVSAGECKLDSSNGAIQFFTTNIAGELTAETSNGRILFERSTFGGASIVTSNGRISGQLFGSYNDYEFEIDSSSRNSNIESGGKGDCKVKLKTSNANIDIEFSDNMEKVTETQKDVTEAHPQEKTPVTTDSIKETD